MVYRPSHDAMLPSPTRSESRGPPARRSPSPQSRRRSEPTSEARTAGPARRGGTRSCAWCPRTTVAGRPFCRRRGGRPLSRGMRTRTGKCSPRRPILQGGHDRRAMATSRTPAPSSPPQPCQPPVSTGLDHRTMRSARAKSSAQSSRLASAKPRKRRESLRDDRRFGRGVDRRTGPAGAATAIERIKRSALTLFIELPSGSHPG